MPKNLRNINLTVLIFQKFPAGGACPQTPLEKTCASPVMSDHHDNMSDQFFVWTDKVSDHFRIIIIVSVNYAVPGL